MSTRKTTFFYALLIAVASLAEVSASGAKT